MKINIIRVIFILLVINIGQVAKAVSIEENIQKKNLTIEIIVAYQTNGGMGYQGTLPWKLKDDLRHFNRTTMNYTVLMGRKTYYAIGHPLKGRRNMVVSTILGKENIEGIEVYNSVESAIDNAKQNEKIFVIGGRELYKLFIPYADKLHLALVDADAVVDTFFPIEDLNLSNWKKINTKLYKKNNNNEYNYTIQVYKK